MDLILEVEQVRVSMEANARQLQKIQERLATALAKVNRVVTDMSSTQQQQD